MKRRHSKKRTSIGIRRETRDKTQRRAPLSPRHVRHLVQEHGIRVRVQSWDGRVFADDEYRRAGADIGEDLSETNIIFGVKEIASEHLEHGGVYCYFSHTVKGQRENMPMLRTLMERGCTLLDYELVRDAQGKRTIYFGDYAGYAGMIDTLWALGRRLAWEGLRTPFRAIRYATDYGSLAAAQRQIREAGKAIRQQGLPRGVAPLIVAFTGYGRVSVGAQSIFDLLPHREVEPDDVAELVKSGEASRHHVYKTVLHKPHLYRHRSGPTAFSAGEFTRHPERYRSRFAELLPFLTVIVNGIYWEPGYPRLVTRRSLERLFAKRGQPRLRVIGDITCDVCGSIEATVKATDSRNPVFVYQPATGRVRDGWKGRGPVVLAVDKLPTELPREASEAFGRELLPYVPALARGDFSLPLNRLDLSEDLRRAIIVHRGRLTRRYHRLEQALRRRR